MKLLYWSVFMHRDCKNRLNHGVVTPVAVKLWFTLKDKENRKVSALMCITLQSILHHSTLKTLRTSVRESLQMHFEVAVRDFHANIWFLHVRGYYQQDSGCKMIRAAVDLSGCLVQLVSNTKINPHSFQHDCKQGSHSVVKTTNLLLQCMIVQTDLHSHTHRNRMQIRTIQKGF